MSIFGIVGFLFGMGSVPPYLASMDEDRLKQTVTAVAPAFDIDPDKIRYRHSEQMPLGIRRLALNSPHRCEMVHNAKLFARTPVRGEKKTQPEVMLSGFVAHELAHCAFSLWSGGSAIKKWEAELSSDVASLIYVKLNHPEQFENFSTDLIGMRGGFFNDANYQFAPALESAAQLIAQATDLKISVAYVQALLKELPMARFAPSESVNSN